MSLHGRFLVEGKQLYFPPDRCMSLHRVLSPRQPRGKAAGCEPLTRDRTRQRCAWEVQRLDCKYRAHHSKCKDEGKEDSGLETTTLFSALNVSITPVYSTETWPHTAAFTSLVWKLKLVCPWFLFVSSSLSHTICLSVSVCVSVCLSVSPSLSC